MHALVLTALLGAAAPDAAYWRELADPRFPVPEALEDARTRVVHALEQLP